MQRILMVCLGNICRSPLAEGLLKTKLNKNDFLVDSAGTGNYHVGNLPDSRAIKIAAKYHLNITDQRARQFQQEDFDTFDIIYVMDKNNLDNIMKMARNSADKKKVQLLLNSLNPNKNTDVPDPYFGGEEGFEEVFKLLDKATEIIAKKLQ